MIGFVQRDLNASHFIFTYVNQKTWEVLSLENQPELSVSLEVEYFEPRVKRLASSNNDDADSAHNR